jgi:hypothetical protein
MGENAGCGRCNGRIMPGKVRIVERLWNNARVDVDRRDEIDIGKRQPAYS